jgi:hypothetical protein
MKEEKIKHKIPDWAIKRKIDFRCLCEEIVKCRNQSSQRLRLPKGSLAALSWVKARAVCLLPNEELVLATKGN